MDTKQGELKMKKVITSIMILGFMYCLPVVSDASGGMSAQATQQETHARLIYEYLAGNGWA
jgi:hypothetical protein